MNYSSNTFVISIGEHLTAIAFQAPWMNGQPLNHGQAYMILAGLHEELFNEMFPWANIDNSLHAAIERVYEGFAALVPAKPTMWVHQRGEWALASTPPAGYNVVNISHGHGLPKTPHPHTAYLVHGGRTYDKCFDQFMDTTIAHIRWCLRTELNKYLGTKRDYEWYYEYTGNGITYTRQDRAVISYVSAEPTTELELLNQEISLQPKLERPTNAYVAINLAEHESRGGYDRTTGETMPDKFGVLLSSLPAVVNQLAMDAMQSGTMKAEVFVRYVNPVFLREVCDQISYLSDHLPVKFMVRSEQVQVGLAPVAQRVDRALHQRSFDQVYRETAELAGKLTVIRDRIARRNNVTELDIREVNSLDKNILNATVHYEDMYVSVNNREHWYKFGDNNPAELQQTVIATCLLLSNYIDVLTGNTATDQRQPVPTFEPRKDDKPIGVIPIYCK